MLFFFLTLQSSPYLKYCLWHKQSPWTELRLIWHTQLQHETVNLTEILHNGGRACVHLTTFLPSIKYSSHITGTWNVGYVTKYFIRAKWRIYVGHECSFAVKQQNGGNCPQLRASRSTGNIWIWQSNESSALFSIVFATSGCVSSFQLHNIKYMPTHCVSEGLGNRTS